MAYEFHYTPTGTGAISGTEVLEQTEDAINDLGNTAISGVREALDKAEQAFTNSANAVDDAQTALNTANNAEGVAIQAQNDVSNLSGTVTNIGNRVTTAEGNIGNLQGRMTTAEGNIGNLQGRMTTAEGNIGNLQTAVSAAQATANSAQQTATTARQQSYVFRYSSTALTPSSTNSNALLDNTDNLKVGDKVIDSSGVLFSITAIDTQNSTFTIGTALIDLAQDSDVVHKSGNETISGELTLSDTLNSSDIVPRSNNTYDFGSVSNLLRNLYTYHGYFRGQQQGDEYSSNARTNLTLTSNRDTLGQSGCVIDTFRENTTQGTGNHTLGFGMKENSVRYEGCRFSWSYDDDNNGYIFSLRPTTRGTNQPIKYELGDSTSKWSTINGLNPSSLGMPDLNNGIDISSYIDVSQTSQYTAPADGYISICGHASSTNAILIKDHDYDFAMTARALTTSLGTATYLIMPVIKNHVYDINCNMVTTIDYAKFFPCQGNV